MRPCQKSGTSRGQRLVYRDGPVPGLHGEHHPRHSVLAMEPITYGIPGLTLGGILAPTGATEATVRWSLTGKIDVRFEEGAVLLLGKSICKLENDQSHTQVRNATHVGKINSCLLYTSDAADEP